MTKQPHTPVKDGLWPDARLNEGIVCFVAGDVVPVRAADEYVPLWWAREMRNELQAKIKQLQQALDEEIKR